jgi:hypothetical protein
MNPSSETLSVFEGRGTELEALDVLLKLASLLYVLKLLGHSCEFHVL